MSFAGSTTVRGILQRKALQTGARLPVFEFQDLDDFTSRLVAIDSILTLLSQTHTQLQTTLTTTETWENYWKENLKPTMVGGENAVRENQCNLIENHTKFNKTAVKSLMNETLFLATIREPVRHLKSVANYMGMYKAWNITTGDRLATFIENPSYYDTTERSKNYMAKAFGYTKEQNVDTFLQELNQTFDVIINECFDESLMVLRKKYRWTLNDMLYIQFYIFKYTEKTIPIEQSVHDKVYAWSNIDGELHNMFLERQIQIEKQYGQEFQEDLQIFRHINRNVTNFCTIHCKDFYTNSLKYETVGEVLDNLEYSKIEIPATKLSHAFTFDLLDCIMLVLHEKIVNWFIQIQQRPLLCQKGLLDDIIRLKVFEPGQDVNMEHVKNLCSKNLLPKYNLPYEFSSQYYGGCMGL